MKLHFSKLIAFLLLAAGLFQTALSQGVQGHPEKLPDGPLIRKVPDNAAWEITLVDPTLLLPSRGRTASAASSPSASATPTPKDNSEIVQWNFSRAGKTAGIEMITRGGGKTSIWGMGPSPVAVKAPGDAHYSVVEVGEEISLLRYGSNDYPHTSLVAPKNFAGRVDIDGSTYLLFKNSGADSQGNDSGMVLVDEKTRLPHAAVENGKGYLFRFLPSPSSLVPPPDAAMALKNEKARLNRLNAVPPHP